MEILCAWMGYDEFDRVGIGNMKGIEILKVDIMNISLHDKYYLTV